MGGFGALPYPADFAFDCFDKPPSAPQGGLPGWLAAKDASGGLRGADRELRRWTAHV
jgi:hypothetical protein